MSTEKKTWQPLPREEVIKAVERRNPRRIPLVMAKWWGEGLNEQYGERLREFDRFPSDVAFMGIPKFDVGAMGLSWQIEKSATYDNSFIIDDWAKLDEFIEKLPDPSKDPAFDQLAEQVEKIREQNLYLINGWWGLFFETPWALRGMANVLVDYYVNPDKVHRLHAALCELYCKSIQKAAEVLKPDGFWTSDDLGHQTQCMMRPEIFDEFLKPYYRKIGSVLRKNKIHWWLHSCGNNTLLLPALIDAGVDMFHPVQKHTMDEEAIVREFGDRLGFWSGFDVQHILQENTPDEVRAEMRHLIDTFDHPGGGMAIAAGNGIVNGTPFENIEAFLDEACVYGQKHRQQFAG